MKQNVVAVQAVPGRAAICVVLIAMAAFVGCTGKPRPIAVQSFRMGERVTVGKVIYNIAEAEWKMELGEGSGVRVPKHRFLLVRLTATNSGAEDASMPLLSLYSNKGEHFRELDNGDHVSGWMGLIRIFKSGQTYSGTILFDVQPNSYKLQLTDGGEPGAEIFAYVDIPLQLESDPTLSTPPAIEKKK